MADETANGLATVQNAPEIAIAAIRENPAALRAVDKTTEDYQQLVDSIRDRGVLNPIVVRRLKDGETGEEFFGLVDGLHRYSATQDAGRTTIPVRIVEAGDMEALELQIIANARKVQTRPVEYTKGIQRLMSADPLMTIPQLAKKLSCSPQFINDRMGLLKLADNIAALVDEGKIPLSNAYVLAKLKDPQEQLNFLERAITESPNSLAPMVQARLKEINQAKREGRAANPPGFAAVPTLQKLGDLKNELDNPTVGPFLIADCKPKDMKEAFHLAIAWVLHMDPKSIEQQRAEWDRREAEKKNKKDAAAKEKAMNYSCK